jgi:alcohol/geraniol dehydrogenase (NADP+)
MSIRAFAAKTARQRLEPFTYDPKPLGPHEVEVAITHCGICHSDVHLVDNDWGNSGYPLVPGHEIVGTVSKRGDMVRHLEIGQRVGIGWQCDSCGTCEWCSKGEENMCHQHQAVANGHFGGFAEQVIANSQFVFPIPDRLESENAAPLLCGGVTVYSPMRQYRLEPTMKAGVIGIGGLGHLALQFANKFGCQVTAFSHSASKEAEAKGFGAHDFVDTSDPKNLQARAGSLDFLISTVYADLDWVAYLNVLRPHGKLCFVGAALGPVSVPVMALMMGQKSITGSIIGGRPMIYEMLDFAARHRVQAKTELMPMAECNTALDKVRQGKARYRMVLKN